MSKLDLILEAAVAVVLFVVGITVLAVERLMRTEDD